MKLMAALAPWIFACISLVRGLGSSRHHSSSSGQANRLSVSDFHCLSKASTESLSGYSDSRNSEAVILDFAGNLKLIVVPDIGD